jgi:hypothetical protein
MAQLNKVEEITSVWRALADISRNHEGWMTMPVAAGGPCILKAGRHFPGREEAVLAGFGLLPSSIREALPEGRGFSVREVFLGDEGDDKTWIALMRLPTGSLEMFTLMAADIVSTLEAIPAVSTGVALTTFLSRIRAWQNFMQRGKDEVLSHEAEVGLHGELAILDALLHAGLPPDLAVTGWVGPCNGVQDFFVGSGAIEVKTTTASPGIFPTKISSLEQLDDSQHAPLFLAAVRICQADIGMSLPERIQSIREKLQERSPEILPEFDMRLLQAGYINFLADRYVRKFEQIETRIFPVDDTVPRLTHAMVPVGILRAKYEIDIETIKSNDVSLDAALHCLGGL